MTESELGLPVGQIAVRPYSPEWPRLFQEEKQRLRVVLGTRVLAIEHIGSTSVQGLAAKLVLDIGAVAASFEAA